MQWAMWLILPILQSIRFGVGVELTATPSPVTEGGSLTLTCSVTENSSVFATFNYEDGRIIGAIQLSGGVCYDGSTAQACDQQCSCTTDGKSYSLTISSVTRSWDKARVRCQVSNPGLTNSDILEISVIYPPTGILKVSPTGTQSVLTGTSVTLQCQVGGGNPLATLTWQCKGSPVTGPDLTNTTTAVSSLTVNVDETYHQQQCVCTAGHQASPNGVFGTVTVGFNILYGPDVATFAIAYTSPFYEGDHVYLDCMIDGGNPLTTLTWTCVDQSKETSTNMDTISRAVRRLAISSITKAYNTRQCTCTATHVGLSPSLTKSAVITVYYPPSIPVLAVDTTNGGALPWLHRPTFTGILTCTATEGNPPTTRISWYNNGVSDPDQSAITRRFDPPDKNFNGHTFTCRAGNNFTDTKGTSTESNGIMLNIEYDPIITLDESAAYINESLSFSRTCSAQGNPTPTVSWDHDTTPIQSQRTLQFSSTDRQDAGTYTCTATARSTNGNIALESTKLFNLVIQYGPDVDLAITNTTENTTNVRLTCTANGVPTQYTYRWTHMFGSTVIRDTFDHVTSSGSVSTLTIPKVTYQDMGTYICEVDNGYRGRDGQIVQRRQGVMSVTGSPHAIEAQTRYVTEKDTSLDINITYISFPEPVNTTVSRPDVALPPQSELSVNVSDVQVTVSFYNKNISVDGYMVRLHFNKFETKHRGQYQLYVRNVFTYYYNFEVIISDKPDSPSSLVVGEITQNGAVISWIPGDDNGNSQTFTLIYQQSSGALPTEVTMNDTISLFTVENLDISTKYDVTVYASNSKGTSGNITSTFSTKSDETPVTNAAIIGGAAGSVAAVIVIVCVVVAVVIIRRRSVLSGPKLTEDESDGDNDGLKANVLYESAGPNYPHQPGPSNSDQSGRDVYAVVDKSKSKGNVAETQLYAEVNKPKKGAPESALHADVQKTKKGKAKKVAKKTTKEVPESSMYAEVKKPKKGKKDNKEGMVYENIGDVAGKGKQRRGQDDDIYENGATPTNNGFSSRKKNADGLIYIDVEFKEEANKDKKFVIHGIENKTDYADVDFSKHADPLPEDDENESNTVVPNV